MKKFLFNLCVASATLLTIGATTPNNNEIQPVKSNIEDYIVEHCDYKESYDYIITYDKQKIYDRAIVKKQGTIYKGAYYIYMINCYYYNDYGDKKSIIYVADVIINDNNEEIILSFKKDEVK